MAVDIPAMIGASGFVMAAPTGAGRRGFPLGFDYQQKGHAMNQKKKELISDILTPLHGAIDEVVIGIARSRYEEGLYRSNEPTTRKRALEFLIEYLSAKTEEQLVAIREGGL